MGTVLLRRIRVATPHNSSGESDTSKTLNDKMRLLKDKWLISVLEPYSFSFFRKNLWKAHSPSCTTPTQLGKLLFAIVFRPLWEMIVDGYSL